MKVYVDGEMPKDCLDCPCNSEYYYCNLLHETIDLDNVYSVSKNCPLQSLAEHEKELIKKIKLALRKQVCQMQDDEHCYSQKAVLWQDVVTILGQIEKY